jgi:hypothetical protein
MCDGDHPYPVVELPIFAHLGSIFFSFLRGAVSLPPVSQPTAVR